MTEFKKGDSIRKLKGYYQGHPTGSPYNLPDSIGIVLQASDGYVIIDYDGRITPSVSPKCFELVDPVQEAIKLLQSKGYNVAEPTPRTMEIAVYYYVNNKDQLKVVSKSKFDKWPKDRYTLVDVINWTEPK